MKLFFNTALSAVFLLPTPHYFPRHPDRHPEPFSPVMQRSRRRRRHPRTFFFPCHAEEPQATKASPHFSAALYKQVIPALLKQCHPPAPTGGSQLLFPCHTEEPRATKTSPHASAVLYKQVMPPRFARSRHLQINFKKIPLFF